MSLDSHQSAEKDRPSCGRGRRDTITPSASCWDFQAAADKVVLPGGWSRSGVRNRHFATVNASKDLRWQSRVSKVIVLLSWLLHGAPQFGQRLASPPKESVQPSRRVRPRRPVNLSRGGRVSDGGSQPYHGATGVGPGPTRHWRFVPVMQPGPGLRPCHGDSQWRGRCVDPVGETARPGTTEASDTGPVNCLRSFGVHVHSQSTPEPFSFPPAEVSG